MSMVVRARIPTDLALTLVGLILAWDVAQGSLLQLPGSGAAAGAATILYLVGAVLSLLAHDHAQRRILAAARWFGAGAHAGAAVEDGPAWQAELATAVAGPVVHLLLAVAVILVARLAYVSDGGDAFIRALAAVATLNFVLAMANVVPASPMDGGRLLRSLIQAAGGGAARAGGVAGAVGEGVGLIIVATALTAGFDGDLADAVSWIGIGAIVWRQGRDERSAAGRAQAAVAPPTETRKGASRTASDPIQWLGNVEQVPRVSGRDEGASHFTP